VKLASRKWLRRAGLIVGLAGAVWLTLFIFAVSEGRFSWYSVPTVIVFVLPFLAIIAIAWKWSLIGGNDSAHAVTNAGSCTIAREPATTGIWDSFSPVPGGTQMKLAISQMALGLLGCFCRWS